MMNCKEGDLARVVRSHNGNRGKIVRCVRFVGDGPPWSRYRDHWEIDPPLVGELYPAPTISDSCLRPIRGEEGEDEILRIAGRPRELVSG